MHRNGYKILSTAASLFRCRGAGGRGCGGGTRGAGVVDVLILLSAVQILLYKYHEVDISLTMENHV